jgi:gliding motility-associated-like protein
MKKIISSFIFLAIFSFSLFSQQQQALKWFVGGGIMLDFSQPQSMKDAYPFVRTTDTSYVNTILCDSSSNTLLYVQNDTVFFPIVKEKIALADSLLNFQGVTKAIAGGENKDFYLFILSKNSFSSNDLYFCKGHFDLANDTVIFDKSFTSLENGLSSKLAVFDWISPVAFVHKLGNSDYEIINPDSSKKIIYGGTISYGTSLGSGEDSGDFKCNPVTGDLIATYPTKNLIKYFYFNKETDSITKSKELDLGSLKPEAIGFGTNMFYFSDNKDIYQVKIDGENLIVSSQAVATAGANIVDFQKGIDDKIYVAKKSSRYLGVILDPFLFNQDCFYEDSAITKQSVSSDGFPDFPANIFSNLNFINWSPDTPSTGIQTNFLCSFSLGDADSIIWKFSDGQIISSKYDTVKYFYKPGIYQFSANVYFPKNSGSLWDSVVYRFKIKVGGANIHLLFPVDTLICSSPQQIPIKVQPKSVNYKYKWVQKSTGNITYTRNPQHIVTTPDFYYLTVIDTITGNEVFKDSSLINYYEFTKITPLDSVFDKDSVINFDVLKNKYPPSSPDAIPAKYIWNFGDQSDQQSQLSSAISYHYSKAGKYLLDLKVDVNGQQCTYDLKKNIYIKDKSDTIIASKPFLNLHDTIICDTLKSSVELSIPTTSYTYQIRWYYAGKRLPLYDDKEKVIVRMPGWHKVELFDQNGKYLGADSAIIRFKYRDNLKLTLLVNSSENYFIPGHQTDNYFECKITELSSECNNNFADYKFVWDFGDGDIETTTSDALSHSYKFPGDYIVSVYLYDSHHIEHVVRKRIIVWNKTPDTIYVQAKQTDKDGNYIFDLKNNFKKFNDTNFVFKHQFFRYFDSTRMDQNVTSTYVFDIPKAAKNGFDKNNLTVMLKAAIEGNFSIKLKTPSGDETNIFQCSDYPSQKLLLGRPVNDFYEFNEGLTQTLYINAKGGNRNIENSKFYYRPDGQVEIGNFEYLLSNIQSFEDNNYPTLKNIGGQWQLEIKPTGSHSKLRAIGLEFSPDYYKSMLIPDSVVCHDDMGNEYKTDAYGVLKISNLAGMNNVLNCKIDFKSLGLEQTKILVIKNAQIQNFFSPNGDGINDFWKPVSEAQTQVQITVVDKLGRVVANFNASQKPEGWDGTYKGKPLPSDSYWYIITFPDGTVEKGVLNLVR